jgi:hypothetical protein
VQRLIQRGDHFRPSIAEVVAALDVDADLPTWSEAYTAIIGICWKPSRLDEAHEAVRLFVEAQGLGRLQTLPLNDPDWGHVEQRRLGDQYAEFVERYRERQREGRALEALGRSHRGELGKPDWRALSAEGPSASPSPTGGRARSASLEEADADDQDRLHRPGPGSAGEPGVRGRAHALSPPSLSPPSPAPQRNPGARG